MAYPKDSGLLIVDTDDSGTGIGVTLSSTLSYKCSIARKLERKTKDALHMPGKV